MSFENYTLAQYKIDIDDKGFKSVWSEILEYCNSHDTKNTLLDIYNFGDLYETGLAHVNKEDKKEQGIYYTPTDVADILSNYLKELKGENVCDICCGTGNLIISYLDKIGKIEALNLIKGGRLFLYDLDELALEICRTSIGILYGIEYIDNIHCIKGDFLDKSIHIPKNSKVISNPPYFKIKEILENWDITTIIKDSKEFYSAFMEKIVKESETCVIITPFSFIGSEKFYSLRTFLNNYNGFILSFDNVPGNIFRGKKHGVFNTNTSNAVRASITVVENKEGVKGFKISPLIRFSTSEREKLLTNKMLNNFISNKYQVITKENKKYYKCFNELLPVFKKWNEYSSKTFKSLLSKEPTDYVLSMPKTCRYFVSATSKDLKRTGKITLYFKDKESYEYAYCLLNSSFAYLYWRIYEGAITFSDGLLKSMPIFLSILNDDQKKEIHNVVSKMIGEEDNYLVYKKNASEMQENVKFPKEYRDTLNTILIDIFDIKYDIKEFDIIHSNSVFIENKKDGGIK